MAVWFSIPDVNDAHQSRLKSDFPATTDYSHGPPSWLSPFDHIWPLSLVSKPLFPLCLRYMPPLAPSAPYRDNPNRSDELQLPAEDPLFEAPSHHAGEALGWGYRHRTVDGSYSSGWVYQLTSIRYLSIWTWWIIAPLISGSCVSHSYCISLVPGVLSAISPSQLLSWILYISICVGNTDGNCFFLLLRSLFFPSNHQCQKIASLGLLGTSGIGEIKFPELVPQTAGQLVPPNRSQPREEILWNLRISHSSWKNCLVSSFFFIAPRQTKIQRQHPLFPRPSM